MPAAEPSAPPPRRSPTLAVILSGLFPGLGQLYNRERLKALLFFVGAVLTGIWPLSPLSMDIDMDDPIAGLRAVMLWSVPFLAIALWSVIDAYRTAKQTTDG